MSPCPMQTLAALPKLPASLNDSSAMVLVGLGVMGLIYLMVLRPAAQKNKRRKRPDPLATPPSVRSSLAGERSAERGMQTLLLELENMSRQMSAQLDTKAAKLEALIREADAKTAALQSLLARDKAGALADRLMAGDESGRHRPARPAREAFGSGLAALASHRSIYDLSDAGDAAAAIARKLNRPAGEVELILALRHSGGAIS